MDVPDLFSLPLSPAREAVLLGGASAVVLACSPLLSAVCVRYLSARQEAVSAGAQVDAPLRSLIPGRRPFLLSPVFLAALMAFPLGVGAWQAWEHGRVLLFVLGAPVVALTCTAACVDLYAHLLPNRLLGLGALWAGLVCPLALLARSVIHDAAPAVSASSPLPAPAALRSPACTAQAWGVALGCAVALGVLGLVLHMLGGLGMGDVKLYALMGLWLGLYGLFWPLAAFVIGAFAGGVMALGVGLARIVTHRGRGEPFAYGPPLVVGMIVAWLLLLAQG